MPSWGLPNLKSKRKDTERVLVICGCGRERATDNMVDLSKMPANLNLPDYVCDACISTLYREGVITPRQVYASHNAPPFALVRADQLKERLYPSPTGKNQYYKKIQRNKGKPIKDTPPRRN